MNFTDLWACEPNNWTNRAVWSYNPFVPHMGSSENRVPPHAPIIFLSKVKFSDIKSTISSHTQLVLGEIAPWLSWNPNFDDKSTYIYIHVDTYIVKSLDHEIIFIFLLIYPHDFLMSSMRCSVTRNSCLWKNPGWSLYPGAARCGFDSGSHFQFSDDFFQEVQ